MHVYKSRPNGEDWTIQMHKIWLNKISIFLIKYNNACSFFVRDL